MGKQYAYVSVRVFYFMHVQVYVNAGLRMRSAVWGSPRVVLRQGPLWWCCTRELLVSASHLTTGVLAFPSVGLSGLHSGCFYRRAIPQECNRETNRSGSFTGDFSIGDCPVSQNTTSAVTRRTFASTLVIL